MLTARTLSLFGPNGAWCAPAGLAIWRVFRGAGAGIVVTIRTLLPG